MLNSFSDYGQDAEGNDRLPSNTGENSRGGEYVNAPLAFLGQNPPKGYHGDARGKQLFKAQVSSPDFRKAMKVLGLKSLGRPSDKPIEVVVYNDAQDPRTKTYYAKFIEYGFTWFGHYNQHTGAWIEGDGSWHPGLRLFAKLRKWIKRELVRQYKATAKEGGWFTRATIQEAMEITAGNTVDKLKGLTEEQANDTGRMKDHWKWFTR